MNTQNTANSSSNNEKTSEDEQLEEAMNQAQLAKIAYSHLIFNPKKVLAIVARHCQELYDAVSFITRLS